MKKLLIAGTILLGISFVSCKKCQTCTTTTIQDYGTYQQTSNTNQEYCGKEYDDAPAEGTTNQSAGGVTQTVTTTCVDK